MIVWSGLNKPAARNDLEKVVRPIKLEPTDAALKAIEKFKSQDKEEDDSGVHVGVSCKNAGCDKVFFMKFQSHLRKTPSQVTLEGRSSVT